MAVASGVAAMLVPLYCLRGSVHEAFTRTGVVVAALLATSCYIAYISRARTSCTRISVRTSCTTGDEQESFRPGICGCASATEGARRATGVVLAQPRALSAGGRDARR